MNSQPLPVGTRLRKGAVTVEAILPRDDKVLVYRAYDFPSRRQILIYEFFPDDAIRSEREVLAPSGWSAQGFQIARENWAQNFPAALFSFQENNTLYIACEDAAPEYSARAAAPQIPAAPVSPPPVFLSPSAPREEISSAQVYASPSPSSQPKLKVTWRDVWPDALRGALQGTAFCALMGVLIGLAATLLDDGASALRGLWTLPIGALGGALMGTLRALPSSAAPLASASARTSGERIQSTLCGAGKGVAMSLVMWMALLVLLFARGAVEDFSALVFLAARAFLIFLLAGAMGGGLVGFIGIKPRDRSRRS